MFPWGGGGKFTFRIASGTKVQGKQKHVFFKFKAVKKYIEMPKHNLNFIILRLVYLLSLFSDQNTKHSDVFFGEKSRLRI